MRHLIFTIFLLTLAPVASFAATSCPSDATLETCSTKPGCYWDTTTSTCTLCPAGYYCNGTQEKCPAGTTSDTGSDEKKDCYMQGGKTIIKGKYGDGFTLPDGLKLYYRGS